MLRSRWPRSALLVGGILICTILIVLGVASFNSTINAEIHLRDSYELGVGFGGIYFAKLASVRPRPSGWGVRSGEDYDDFRPWAAKFYFDLPISIPFGLASACILVGARRPLSCSRCGRVSRRANEIRCRACNVTIRRERHSRRESLLLAGATLPLWVVPALLVSHGVISLFGFGATWIQTDFRVAVWSAIGGVLTYLPIRMIYDVQRWQAVDASCANCGYSLTGNVSGNCPECGVAICAHQSGPPEQAG